MLTRRAVLGGGLLALLGCGRAPVEAPASAAFLDPSTRFYIPGYRTSVFDVVTAGGEARLRRNLPPGYDDRTVLMSLIRADGTAEQVLFPLRGHDVEISPDGRIGHINALEFQTYVTFDAETLDIIGQGAPVRDDWFGGGHSAFVAGGDVLAVSERAPKQPFSGVAEDHHGFISLRDPESSRVIGGFSSYGISPHEIKVMEDGQHLAISNTGTIVPQGMEDYGVPRQVHDPALAIVEIASGRLVERLPGDRVRELRHIAPARGRDVFGIQTELVLASAPGHTQRPSPEPVPTDALHQYNMAPTLGFLSPDRAARELGNLFQRSQMIHGLSIEYDPDHHEIIATYPDVHRIMVFDAATGEVKQNIRTDRWGIYSPCGVAMVPGQDFYVITGYWEGIYIFDRGSHGLRRELSHQPVTYGHSHIAVSSTPV